MWRVLACKVAGRMEGLVAVCSTVLGTAFLAGVAPAVSGGYRGAYVELGSIVLSLPLLMVAGSGSIVAFFARRPDLV